MGFLCMFYVHMYNLYSISECLSGWLICDLIHVKILKNIFKKIYFHPLFLFFHLSIFDKHRELNIYLICGTK